jgi:hypothetical protein
MVTSLFKTVNEMWSKFALWMQEGTLPELNAVDVCSYARLVWARKTGQMWEIEYCGPHTPGFYDLFHFWMSRKANRHKPNPDS